MDEANPSGWLFFDMHRVWIKKNLLDQMIQHARSESPLECCGLLSGSRSVIQDLHRMSNHAQSTVRFEMDPIELFQFFRNLRATENVHLGIYHSHPSTEAYPSATDIQESFYPDCSYFIVSLKDPRDPQIRAFQIADRKVRGLEVSELE